MYTNIAKRLVVEFLLLLFSQNLNPLKTSTKPDTNLKQIFFFENTFQFLFFIFRFLFKDIKDSNHSKSKEIFRSVFLSVEEQTFKTRHYIQIIYKKQLCQHKVGFISFRRIYKGICKRPYITAKKSVKI